MYLGLNYLLIMIIAFEKWITIHFDDHVVNQTLLTKQYYDVDEYP